MLSQFLGMITSKIPKFRHSLLLLFPSHQKPNHLKVGYSSHWLRTTARLSLISLHTRAQTKVQTNMLERLSALKKKTPQLAWVKISCHKRALLNSIGKRNLWINHLERQTNWGLILVLGLKSKEKKTSEAPQFCKINWSILMRKLLSKARISWIDSYQVDSRTNWIAKIRPQLSILYLWGCFTGALRIHSYRIIVAQKTPLKPLKMLSRSMKRIC